MNTNKRPNKVMPIGSALSVVVGVDEYGITFNTGEELSSAHICTCREKHYLCFKDLNLSDFDGLQFDLSGNDFFERVECYGIRLIPVVGFPVSIPGYGYNNGHYSANLSLVITKDGGGERTFEIDNCQVIRG